MAGSRKPTRLTDNSEYHWNADLGSLMDRHGRDIAIDHGMFCDKLKDWRQLDGDVRARMHSAKVVLLDASGYEHNTEDPFLTVVGSENSYTLTTGNLVGELSSSLGKKEVRVQVSSRFGDNFLRYLLMDADGFLPLDGGGVSKSDVGVDWMLMFAWLAKLRGAVSFGLPKAYESEIERLPLVRGRLNAVDFAINKSTGRYLCDYRRHSYCNMATLLVSRVFDLLGRRAIGLCPDMNNIRQAFKQATEGRMVKDIKLLETGHFSNPLYVGYNSVINFSKYIIRRMSGEIGDDVNASSFLFDMSMLFEYYVRKLLIRNGFEMLEKDDNSFLSISRGLGDEERKLKPDLLFVGSAGPYVFDVKYKYFSTMPRQGGVDRDDLYQLHTYVGAYGNCKDYDVAGCGFVYPVKEDRWQTDFGFNEDTWCAEYDELPIVQHKKKVPFHVVFIRIPQDQGEKVSAESFREYILRIGKSETDFIKLMRDSVLKC